jgi:NAD(P)-dependent dehydrogenase (short-subunit alcohol dehydrogenase family)
MRVNLDGAFLCLQRAARRMVAAGEGGRLVAVTSVHETAPRVGSTDYVSAKHGLGGLVKNAALELSQHGSPSTPSPRRDRDAADRQRGRRPDDVERPGVPLGRVGSAHEIAATVAFLCSDAASYTTGASYVVDGGMLLMGPHGGSDLPSHEWREG